MSQVFYAQDEAGNQCRILQALESSDAQAGAATVVYRLEDGTPVRRVDSDTFQIVGTGAYVTIVRA
ncbi:MAG: hypothetical protein QM761_03225 [Pseudoxanthomonas sp.]